MAEYCEFDWTGYMIPISPSSAPYTPTKEVRLEKGEALKALKNKISNVEGNRFLLPVALKYQSNLFVVNLNNSLHL